jgi:hypothetical protein
MRKIGASFDRVLCTFLIVLSCFRDHLAIGPVDVVFTWVKEPNTSEFETIKSFCTNNAGYNLQRFRDTGTLYRALMSVKSYIPWVRKIFLVTSGHLPCWFRESHNVFVVTHSEIWPAEKRLTELPTYNSVSIEAHLHRIPGLAEQFIYLNDDMFIGRPLPYSFFFNTTNHKPITSVKDSFWLPYELLDQENSIWQRSSNFSLNNSEILIRISYPDTPKRPAPGYLMGTHGPYVTTKSLIHIVQSKWPELFQKLSSCRCRTPLNTLPGIASASALRPPFWIYQWYAIVSSYSEPVERDIPFLSMFSNPTQFFHELLSRPSVEFFILNDDYSLDPREAMRQISEQQHFLDLYLGYDVADENINMRGEGCKLLRSSQSILSAPIALPMQNTSNQSHPVNQTQSRNRVITYHFGESVRSNVHFPSGIGVGSPPMRIHRTYGVAVFDAGGVMGWRRACRLIGNDLNTTTQVSMVVVMSLKGGSNECFPLRESPYSSTGEKLSNLPPSNGSMYCLSQCLRMNFISPRFSQSGHVALTHIRCVFMVLKKSVVRLCFHVFVYIPSLLCHNISSVVIFLCREGESAEGWGVLSTHPLRHADVVPGCLIIPTEMEYTGIPNTTQVLHVSIPISLPSDLDPISPYKRREASAYQNSSLMPLSIASDLPASKTHRNHTAWFNIALVLPSRSGLAVVQRELSGCSPPYLNSSSPPSESISRPLTPRNIIDLFLNPLSPSLIIWQREVELNRSMYPIPSYENPLRTKKQMQRHSTKLNNSSPHWRLSSSSPVVSNRALQMPYWLNSHPALDRYCNNLNSNKAGEPTICLIDSTTGVTMKGGALTGDIRVFTSTIIHHQPKSGTISSEWNRLDEGALLRENRPERDSLHWTRLEFDLK